jgi:hypothetical protein
MINPNRPGLLPFLLAFVIVAHAPRETPAQIDIAHRLDRKLQAAGPNLPFQTSDYIRLTVDPMRGKYFVCEPECPAEAIKPDTEGGLEEWLTLNAEYAKVWPNITAKKEPPADSKEWDGKPGKKQYFSPEPGSGD